MVDEKVGYNMNNKEVWKLVTFVVLIMIIFPIITNLLMFVDDFSVAGDEKTWIGYLGSFWGAIIGGAITLIGVRATINHNEEQKRKEEFPKKLFHFENIIDYLEKVDSELVKYNYVTFDERNHYMLVIDDQYNISKLKAFYSYRDELLKKISEDVIYIDAKSYRMFLDFRKKINDLYREVIGDTEIKLFLFTQEVVEQSGKQGLDTVNVPWSKLPLNPSQEQRLNDIRRELYRNEKEYISRLSSIVEEFKLDIQEHYFNVLEEMDY
jgi:hypothetical protein